MQFDATITWSTNLSSPPADTRVLLAYTEDGARKVCVSRWFPPSRRWPAGRWVDLDATSVKRVPYAWAPWPAAPEVR